jgi:predicted dehydrogenase
VNQIAPVRWGILGTAKIANKVGPAIKAAAGAELTAIASRSLERARQWAGEYGVPRAYGSYEELLADPEIEAVYIPLPPSLHAEWTLRAAEQGKHVLCEKPLARHAREAEEMVAACRAHGVQLMDGMMWVHHPRTAAMRRQIDSGLLGPLRRVTAAFTFNWDALPADNIRFQRDLAGGALGDLGWYCVAAILWAFGELPERVFATARYFQDVELNLSALLWFPGERMASFDCGFDTGMRKWFEVAGTAGSLICDDFTAPWDIQKARFWIHDARGKAAEQKSEPCVQEVRMIEDLCAAIRGGALNEQWPATALAIQRVCDLLEESARKGVPLELKL